MKRHIRVKHSDGKSHNTNSEPLSDMSTQKTDYIIITDNEQEPKNPISHKTELKTSSSLKTIQVDSSCKPVDGQFIPVSLPKDMHRNSSIQPSQSQLLDFNIPVPVEEMSMKSEIIIEDD